MNPFLLNPAGSGAFIEILSIAPFTPAGNPVFWRATTRWCCHEVVKSCGRRRLRGGCFNRLMTGDAQAQKIPLWRPAV